MLTQIVLPIPVSRGRNVTCPKSPTSDALEFSQLQSKTRCSAQCQMPLPSSMLSLAPDETQSMEPCVTKRPAQRSLFTPALQSHWLAFPLSPFRAAQSKGQATAFWCYTDEWATAEPRSHKTTEKPRTVGRSLDVRHGMRGLIMVEPHHFRELTRIVGFKRDNHFPKPKKRYGGRCFLKNMLRLQHPTRISKYSLFSCEWWHKNKDWDQYGWVA